MVTVRSAAERGRSDFGWLDSRHTFSFGEYHDPRHMGFRSLRVINDDRVQPGQGFGTHPHRDMEILSVVLEGALEHRDSLGTGSVIRVGDVQRMTAGTGVTHSEFNHSRTDPVHFLQIWLLPLQRGLAPGYEQKPFPEPGRRNALRLIASRDGRDGSVTVHQDVAVHAGHLEAGRELAHRLAPGRHAWVQMTGGRLDLNGTALEPGDGAALSDEAMMRPRAVEAQGDSATFLLFDLA